MCDEIQQRFNTEITPKLDELFDDPIYQEIMKKLGLIRFDVNLHDESTIIFKFYGTNKFGTISSKPAVTKLNFKEELEFDKLPTQIAEYVKNYLTLVSNLEEQKKKEQ